MWFTVEFVLLCGMVVRRHEMRHGDMKPGFEQNLGLGLELDLLVGRQSIHVGCGDGRSEASNVRHQDRHLGSRLPKTSSRPKEQDIDTGIRKATKRLDYHEARNTVKKLNADPTITDPCRIPTKRGKS